MATEPTSATEAFAERLFEWAVGALDLYSVYLGDELGYYRALTGGPLAVGELAARTGTDERYTRGRCEQQATTGILRVDDPTAAEPMLYGWSVVHCLPVGLADGPSAATGTVMRADTLRGYAEEAGVERVEALPIEDDFFRLYRLTPDEGDESRRETVAEVSG